MRSSSGSGSGAFFFTTFLTTFFTTFFGFSASASSAGALSSGSGPSSSSGSAGFFFTTFFTTFLTTFFFGFSTSPSSASSLSRNDATDFCNVSFGGCPSSPSITEGSSLPFFRCADDPPMRDAKISLFTSPCVLVNSALRISSVGRRVAWIASKLSSNALIKSSDFIRVVSSTVVPRIFDTDSPSSSSSL